VTAPTWWLAVALAAAGGLLLAIGGWLNNHLPEEGRNA
jgi:hypothetical protein